VAATPPRSTRRTAAAGSAEAPVPARRSDALGCDTGAPAVRRGLGRSATNVHLYMSAAARDQAWDLSAGPARA
jgi:hypothetical protein